MLGNDEEAADVTQEVFFKVYKKIQTLRDPGYFSTWLFSIAKNEAISLARQKKHKNHTSIDQSDDDDVQRQIQDYSILDPDKKLLNEEFERIFQNILSELPDIYRIAFILGVLEGYSYEEVAKIMNCSVGNVKSRVFRARSRIAQKLNKIYSPKTFQ